MMDELMHVCFVVVAPGALMSGLNGKDCCFMRLFHIFKMNS